MSVLEDLSVWVNKKPLIIVRFDNEESERLNESRRGMERFSFARRHEALEYMQFPTLVLAEFCERDEVSCYVGVCLSKRPVTTLESSLKLVKLRQIDLRSLDHLLNETTDERFKTALSKKLAEGPFVACLSPKLSSHLIGILLSNGRNQGPFETAANALPRLRTVGTISWAQNDAIQIALAVFGVGKDAVAEETKVRAGKDSGLTSFSTRILEDNVIAADASFVPGFEFVGRDLTGRATFRDGERELDIYTANRGPLEELLGVDLIYVHQHTANIVMIQYKMLEPVGEGLQRDHVFRPDSQIEAELSRMNLPTTEVSCETYRMHRSPFYLKFVARTGNGSNHRAFVLSKDHYDLLLNLPASRGPNGGIRISYNSLRGHYLRESDLVGLIRSGYIGTYPGETAALATIIEEVSRGNRSLVLAWQKSVRSDSPR